MLGKRKLKGSEEQGLVLQGLLDKIQNEKL